MANTSLQTYLDANPTKGPVEGAVEVLKTSIAGVTLGASDAAANPGSDASKAISVQGVTGGKAVPVSAAALPLPTGAATATKQTDGSQKTQVVDSLGTAVVLPTHQTDFDAVAVGTAVDVTDNSGVQAPRLLGGSVSVSAAVSLLFKDNDDNVIFRTPKLLADTPYNFVVLGGQGKAIEDAAFDVKVISSASANLTGTVWYRNDA